MNVTWNHANILISRAVLKIHSTIRGAEGLSVGFEITGLCIKIKKQFNLLRVKPAQNLI